MPLLKRKNVTFYDVYTLLLNGMYHMLTSMILACFDGANWVIVNVTN